MEATMTRHDWGGLLNATRRDQSNTAVLEKIGKLRWQGKTHADDGEMLTIHITNQEQSVLFNGLDVFARGGYSNTLETYEQVARVYKAFDLQPPKAQLPHDGGIAYAYVTYAFGFPVAAPTDFATAPQFTVVKDVIVDQTGKVLAKRGVVRTRRDKSRYEGWELPPGGELTKELDTFITSLGGFAE